MRVARPVSFGFVFWPLIGGFIALVLLTVLIGWIVDTRPGGNADEHH